MAEIIRMPKMSDTMEEGVIAGWLKKVGEEVKSGDILAEVETDKATMELESYDDGFLLHVGVKDGESVPVDGILAIIGKKDENIDDVLKEISSKQNKTEDVEAKDEKEEEVAEDNPVEENLVVKEEVEEEVVKNTEDKIENINIDFSNEINRIKASPLAKKLAAEKGIDISMVKGSGDAGRIVKEDIENFKKNNSIKTEEVKLPKIHSEESYQEIPVSQMRKTISKRLAESKFSAPHFYLTMEINMDNCIEGRNKINESSNIKISFNDIIIKASAVALRKHPMVNASFLTDKIRVNNHIHIGVAVAVDEGLLVPVIRFADNKSLSHISTEVRNLAGKAKDKELQPSDWEGNTFTISNLGMFGIDEFTAIINPNDSCILAVGGIKNTPIIKNGEIVPGNIMKVTLSCDHRIVDGATGSSFLKTLKELIEDPIKILV
ncbi:MAG: pyruvate dehydrogenase complex dihydrolipoamide acetyltransferase [Flammeovirgaceae bacterium TMED290]|nr:MAG: pyruvate dehydrogenase complex dihydrolipoamide acetyltransferase [Flammeovirgaceae bacterium TMED290]|tara:strand:+ start:2205 stop:3509 length:1305 start_codon:yes stop_codon:yes gene_type:complete